MMPLENAVAVSGLTKYYNKMPVVDHISFNVRLGEIFDFRRLKTWVLELRLL